MTDFFLKRKDPAGSLAQLQSGLDKINLEDNFLGFEWTGVIAAGEEARIVNKLRNNRVPKGYIVTMLSGSPTLLKGDTEWTGSLVYLKNSSGTDDLTATVFFFI